MFAFVQEAWVWWDVLHREVRMSEEVYEHMHLSLTVKTALRPPSSCLLLAFITSFTHPKAFGCISRSLSPFVYSAFNFLLLSAHPPSLQPWLRLHLWLTTNSLTCRLQHSCPEPPPTPASHKTNTPFRTLPSYAELASHVLWKMWLNLFSNQC